ncbi:MAG: hypothetical protein JST62_05590 [Bacteroidetes bacterium]|nr:hypothetical protein [Bacteroidota bacterium]
MKIIVSTFFVFIFSFSFGQIQKKDSLQTNSSLTKEKRTQIDTSITEKDVLDEIQQKNSIAKTKYLNPTRAGLYSAVLPGLGQYYNKKYWKIPIVWGGVGTGVGIAMWNQKQYNRYREAFVASVNGLPHEFSNNPVYTKEVLGNIQDKAKRQRDYAIAIAGLIYILNIVDAVVDAHLYEGRHDPDLVLKPAVIYDEYGNQSMKTGLSLSYNF